MISHVIIISYIALPHAHAHFDWASVSPHCCSAAEIFNFRLIHVHSNARNSISFPNSKPKYIVPLPFFVSIVSTVAPLAFPSFFPHCLPSRRLVYQLYRLTMKLKHLLNVFVVMQFSATPNALLQ